MKLYNGVLFNIINPNNVIMLVNYIQKMSRTKFNEPTTTRETP